MKPRSNKPRSAQRSVPSALAAAKLAPLPPPEAPLEVPGLLKVAIPPMIPPLEFGDLDRDQQEEFERCRACGALYATEHSCPGHDRFKCRRLAGWCNFLAGISDEWSVHLTFDYELRCRKCGYVPQPDTYGSLRLGEHQQGCSGQTPPVIRRFSPPPKRA